MQAFERVTAAGSAILAVDDGSIEAACTHASEVVIVMDGDGEDCPAHLVGLLAAHAQGGDRIVVAHRLRRSTLT